MLVVIFIAFAACFLLVWWDMLFGTYENPAVWNDRCGFDTERELRLADMLRYRDVHKD